MGPEEQTAVPEQPPQPLFVAQTKEQHGGSAAPARPGLPAHGVNCRMPSKAVGTRSLPQCFPGSSCQPCVAV